jgi:hypothetical protein
VQRSAAVITMLMLVRASHAEPDRAQTQAAMENYFAGEVRGGYALIGMGSAGLLSGGLLFGLQKDSDLARGMSYPLLGFGLAHVAAGIFVTVSSRRRVADFTDQIASDPGKFVTAERTRMKGVSMQFTVLEVVEVVLIAGGITTAVLARRADRKQLEGIGYGVALEAALTLGFDIIAGRRAHGYRDDLAGLDVTTALDPRGAPLVMITHTGAF